MWAATDLDRCDDGNLLESDGCNSTCYVEDGWEIATMGALGVQPQGLIGTMDVMYEICGDGKWLGYYACDDNNTIAGDGCDANCAIEPGWGCVAQNFIYCYKAAMPAITNCSN